MQQLTNELAQRLFLVLSQKTKQESKANANLVRRNLTSQLQPFSGRQLNFHAHDFANVDPAHRINKTSTEAKVFDPAFVITRQPSPLGREVCCNSFVAAPVFSH